MASSGIWGGQHAADSDRRDVLERYAEYAVSPLDR